MNLVPLGVGAVGAAVSKGVGSTIVAIAADAGVANATLSYVAAIATPMAGVAIAWIYAHAGRRQGETGPPPPRPPDPEPTVPVRDPILQEQLDQIMSRLEEMQRHETDIGRAPDPGMLDEVHDRMQRDQPEED